MAVFAFQLHPTSALRVPMYRRYFIASCQSTFATWSLRFPLGWMAWELTHSVFWVGVFSACLLLPTIFLAPLFGVLADRVNQRNGLLTTLGILSMVSAAAALATLADAYSLVGLLATALIVGVIGSAHQPMRLAMLPLLVPRESLPSAIGLSAIIFNTARIVGPAVAGIIIAHGSAALALLVSAITYGGAVLALSRVRIPRPEKANSSSSLMAQLREGLAYASGHSAIRLALGLTLINGFLGRTVLELLPAISGKLLAGDARQLAWLTAGAGAGSIVGGLILTRFRDSVVTLCRVMLASVVLAAGLVFGLSWVALPLLMTGVVALLSLATTMAGISGQAMVQLCVADHVRGRVMSLWSMLIMGAPAVGSLIIGAFAEHFGFHYTLAVDAVLALGFILWFWWLSQ